MARDDPQTLRLTLHGKPSRKVAIYVLDNQTSGPVGRAAKLARQLKADGMQVTVLMGEHCAGQQFFDADIPILFHKNDQKWWRREGNLKYQLAKLKPDVLLIDEYPFVAQDYAVEWQRVIKAARTSNKDCKVLSSCLDIPIYYMEEEAPNLEARSNQLDGILVTGDPTISRVEDRIPSTVIDAISSKLQYVGYLGAGSANGVQTTTTTPSNDDIVVYLGGVNLQELVNRYIALIANIPLLPEAMQRKEWRIVLPPNHNLQAERKLRDFIEALPLEIQPHIHLETPDNAFDQKIQSAGMIISGGGQTSIEAAAIHGKSTLIIPGFGAGQFIRAKNLAQRFSWVEAADIAVPKVKTSYYRTPKFGFKPVTKGSTYIVNADWPSQILEKVAEEPTCAELRESMTRVFNGRNESHEKPAIMFDGAKEISRIASGIPHENSLER
jgi:predicted glycosyltransferase